MMAGTFTRKDRRNSGIARNLHNLRENNFDTERDNYERQVADLIISNKALSVSLDIAYGIIKRHEKLISSLQKKLQRRKKFKLFKEKLQGLDNFVKQLSSYRDEALGLYADIFATDDEGDFDESTSDLDVSLTPNTQDTINQHSWLHRDTRTTSANSRLSNGGDIKQPIQSHSAEAANHLSETVYNNLSDIIVNNTSKVISSSSSKVKNKKLNNKIPHVKTTRKFKKKADKKTLKIKLTLPASKTVQASFSKDPKENLATHSSSETPGKENNISLDNIIVNTPTPSKVKPFKIPLSKSKSHKTDFIKKEDENSLVLSTVEPSDKVNGIVENGFIVAPSPSKLKTSGSKSKLHHVSPVKKKIIQDENSMLSSNFKPSDKVNCITIENGILVAPSTSKAKQFKMPRKSKNFKLKNILPDRKKISRKRSSKLSVGNESGNSCEVIVVSDENESPPSKRGSFTKLFNKDQTSKQGTKLLNCNFNLNVAQQSLGNISNSHMLLLLKKPQVVLHDILKHPDYSLDPFVLKCQESRNEDIEIEKHPEEEESQQPLVSMPDLTVDEDDSDKVEVISSDVRIPSIAPLPQVVHDLMPQPIELETTDDISVEMPVLQESATSNSFIVDGVDPFDIHSDLSKDHCSDDPFFKLLQEVTRITAKIPDSS